MKSKPSKVYRSSFSAGAAKTARHYKRANRFLRQHLAPEIYCGLFLDSKRLTMIAARKLVKLLKNKPH
ncbi:MAG: hypothetical protein V1928_02080 [Parcubacteria group bacterium]